MTPKTYHRRVYAGHNRSVNGMDYMRSGRYEGDGVRHCWNLIYSGKLLLRDGQRQVLAMSAPAAVTWGRASIDATVVGSGNMVFAENRK